MNTTFRLAKKLAEQLACSRSEAEQYIEGGWVTVDGQLEEAPGRRISPNQQLVLLPGATLDAFRPVTLLVHKPAGYYADEGPDSAYALIVPEHRMHNDRSAQRYLKRLVRGLKMVTPLERAASGLVVYTQEFSIERKLVHEALRVEQEYIAEVRGTLTSAGLLRLRRGMTYAGEAARPMQVSWQNETHLRFALKSPALGFIEFACQQVGLSLQALRRIRIGRLPLAGLPVGQWRCRLDQERF